MTPFSGVTFVLLVSFSSLCFHRSRGPSFKTVLRNAGAPLATRVSFFFPFVSLEMSLFPSIFVPLSFCPCTESTSYVSPFHIMLFYLVTTWLDFDIMSLLLCKNSINQSKICTVRQQCLCVFFPFILDIKFDGRTSRGHTGRRSYRISHPPSFCGACLHFSREKNSAIPFPRRPWSRILCPNNDLIVLHPLGIFSFSF